MKDESLEKLAAAFREWRSTKRHLRETTPDALVKRAVRAARIHGGGTVARAVKLNRRLLEGEGASKARSVWPATMPSYSRVEVAVPSPAVRPFAEVEMPGGVKVRLYSQTPEAMGLLESVCRGGGGER